MPPLITNLDASTRERINSAFHYVEGARVLRTPLRSITVPDTVPARAALHPVVRARMAADDEWLGVVVDRALAAPLARAAVFAAYLAYEWTPDLYDYAVEKAGQLLADGMPRVDADRRAIALARMADRVPRTCGTCRYHRLLSTTARRGVCEVHETTVDAAQEGPACWARAFTTIEYAIACDLEHDQPAATVAA